MPDPNDRSTEPGQPMSIKRDMANLRRNSGASLDELRQFVRDLRGKSPQEMLGAVAQSDLVRSTAMALVICVILLGVFTGGPLVYAKMQEKKAENAQADGAENGAQDGQGDDKSQQADADKAKPDADAAAAAKKADDNLADTLGIGDAKPADPKVNPLENRTDDLLDGLDD